jgi:hypothetical protein
MNSLFEDFDKPSKPTVEKEIDIYNLERGELKYLFKPFE